MELPHRAFTAGSRVPVCTVARVMELSIAYQRGDVWLFLVALCGSSCWAGHR
jgi:hypothetical protein